MKSRLPKPLHPVCGLPLSRHVVEACRGAGVSRTVVVVTDGVQDELIRRDDLKDKPKEWGRAIREKLVKELRSIVRGPEDRSI